MTKLDLMVKVLVDSLPEILSRLEAGKHDVIQSGDYALVCTKTSDLDGLIAFLNGVK